MNGRSEGHTLKDVGETYEYGFLSNRVLNLVKLPYSTMGHGDREMMAYESIGRDYLFWHNNASAGEKGLPTIY